GGNLFAAASTVVEAMEVEKNGTKVLPITKASPAYNQALTDAATRDQRTMKRPRTNKGTGTGYDIGAYQLGEWTVIGIGTDRPYYTDNILSYRVLDPYGTDVTATVTGKPTLTTPATIASPVGIDYPVVPSLGTLDPSKDYIYINGKFDIYAVPLTITTQPKSQTVNEGSSVTFSVAATGTGLSYQWYKGSSKISGATKATYTISSARSSDAGSYKVVVSNGSGSVTSSVATLKVVPNSISIRQENYGTKVTITFTGTLQESSDMKTWKNVTSQSPYTTSVWRGQKFYRSVQ
ncbi:MAG: immunoglobulin domain-containing protein, partial [Verrucomicrobia bacterium]|nr:immunoglobulin domain-containing protein [Verrucomicrobiota bacterium]